MDAQITMAAKAYLIVTAHRIPIFGTGSSDGQTIKRVGVSSGHRHSPYQSGTNEWRAWGEAPGVAAEISVTSDDRQIAGPRLAPADFCTQMTGEQVFVVNGFGFYSKI
jgi:hypothetical protein